ncbi:MAG: aminodeoxychorismate/anthranilate synthase component II [Acidimicrobiia bacterium]|nr:aminodeoxychorismate/anthranilate synthase component II [Acidimicrobiia bacterium]
MRVLVVDNYDSFTYNLVQYIGELGADPVVYRNDVLSSADAKALAPERIVISPGPGRPEDAGYSMEYITTLSPAIPTLGVCLGLQAAVAAFGGSVGLAPEPRHGKTSPITHDGKGIFAGIPSPFDATRYHSLVATDVPDVFEETAHSDDGVLQGIRHRMFPIEAVQFHPESIMTVHGKAILANFLSGSWLTRSDQSLRSK